MLEDSTKYQKLQIEKEEKAKQFKEQIEELIETPVSILSTSPEREDTIVVKHPFEG